MKREIQAKPFALVRVWRDNPKDVQVIEYFSCIEDAQQYKSRMKKSELYDYAIMKFV